MKSVQELWYALSEQIRQQVFCAIFVEKAETSIKSKAIINILKANPMPRILSIKVVKSCILKDIFDVENDRKNPMKCSRPLASGRIGMKETAVILVFLILKKGQYFFLLYFARASKFSL